MENGQLLKVNYISYKFKKTFDKFIKEETKKYKEKNEEFSFPYITLHKLRHLNITALLENGINLVDVKDNAGYSSIETTLLYTHIYTKNKK